MLRLAFGVLFTVGVTTAGCGGGGDSTAEPTGGTLSATPLPTVGSSLSEADYLSEFSRAGVDILDWVQQHDDLVLEAQDDPPLVLTPDYEERVSALTVEVALLDDEVQRLTPPGKYAAAHVSLAAAVEKLHRSQRLWDEGLATGNGSMVSESTTVLQAGVNSFFDASDRIFVIAESNQ